MMMTATATTTTTMLFYAKGKALETSPLFILVIFQSCCISQGGFFCIQLPCGVSSSSIALTWMPNLTSLQNLDISGCSQLSERCKNNMGEDWPKIAHILTSQSIGKTSSGMAAINFDFIREESVHISTPVSAGSSSHCSLLFISVSIHFVSIKKDSL